MYTHLRHAVYVTLTMHILQGPTGESLAMFPNFRRESSIIRKTRFQIIFISCESKSSQKLNLKEKILYNSPTFTEDDLETCFELMLSLKNTHTTTDREIISRKLFNLKIHKLILKIGSWIRSRKCNRLNTWHKLFKTNLKSGRSSRSCKMCIENV